MSESKIRAELGYAAAAIAEAQRLSDDSTEYLWDDLVELAVKLQELKNKLDRDAALLRDRQAFAEPSLGLKEWLDG